MKTALDQGDREFLREVSRLGAATVQEICDATEVTATAVRQRLNRLQALDFVNREAVRSGRGRPHHVYRVTDEGLRAIGDNYGDLAAILWREMKAIEDSAVRAQVLGRVQRSLVNEYGRNVDGPTIVQRFGQLVQTLVDRGFDVELGESGELPVLRENNCPYHGLASDDRSVCELEKDVFEQVLGSSLVRSQCCLEGDTCCEFQPAADDDGTSAGGERFARDSQAIQ